MDENHSAGSEIQQPQHKWRSWPGSEPSTLEIDVYVRRYSLLVVLARNDDDDDDAITTHYNYRVCQKMTQLTFVRTSSNLHQSW